MKAIIENSVYLLVLSLICFISLDFILVNLGIQKRYEAVKFLEDYIEIHGESESINGEYMLSETVKNDVNDIASANGIKVLFNYKNKTDNYIYYDMIVTYKTFMGVFGIDKENFARYIVKTINLEVDNS